MCRYLEIAFMIQMIVSTAIGFTIPKRHPSMSSSQIRKSCLYASTEQKIAIDVTGEQLEVMLTECEQPLVLDAYATWCGPCVQMAPEFEEAARALEGRVRFIKIDTDKEPFMAERLNINGLPTLLFLDEYKSEGDQDSESEPKLVLKERIEGGLDKKTLIALCEHHFFGVPFPDQLL